MWQDLNPNEYLSPKPAPYSTFPTAAGTIEDQNYPLAPFWDTSGTNFWNSIRVKETKTFGYAYPETQVWTYPNQNAYQTELRATVNRIYGGNVFRNFEQVVSPRTRPTLAQFNLASMSAMKTTGKEDGFVKAAGAEGQKPAQAPLARDEQIPEAKVHEPPKNPVEKDRSNSPSGKSSAL